MTYILDNSFERELQARQEYLYYAFNAYFVVTQRNRLFTVLRSFPILEDNIIIFYGHNNLIIYLFEILGIYMKNCIKIVNSCSLFFNSNVIAEQNNVYYNKLNSYGMAECYEGELFGLSFDVTASELDFLNTKELPLMQRIEFAYRKVA